MTPDSFTQLICHLIRLSVKCGLFSAEMAVTGRLIKAQFQKIEQLNEVARTQIKKFCKVYFKNDSKAKSNNKAKSGTVAI
jgi:hypothetical protein